MLFRSRRATLARALSRTVRHGRETLPGTLSELLARNYWEALSGLVAATVTLLPPAQPLRGASDDE